MLPTFIQYGVVATTCLLSPLANAKYYYDQSPVSLMHVKTTPTYRVMYEALTTINNNLTPIISGNHSKLALIVMNGKTSSSQKNRYLASHPICPMKPKQKANSTTKWQKGGKKAWSDEMKIPKDKKSSNPANPKAFPGVMWQPK